ncbi:MAG: radical SAM protein, partial [Clostridia bacterium]|nr:radical SAM protein [Clostridia bacterium]
MKCNLCPRHCNAERTHTQNVGGFCSMPLGAVVARAALHFGEEPSISGKNGSGTVFFSGCSLCCVYCQNAKISQENYGKSISVNRLAEIFRELENQGAHNINLVSPTHYVHSIIEALSIYKPKIPVVYNSSGYED